MLPVIAAMAASGAANGYLSTKKTAGQDAGNYFAMDPETDALSKGALKKFLGYQGSDAALDPLKSSQIATDQVQSNPLLAAMFGKDGTLARTGAEEQNLAERGFNLKPEDYEAYGQASDNLARQFGHSEQNLGQMLASRGLSQSPMAAQGFSGLMGNKNEQLAQSQRKIADDRMNMNLQRLGQTRNFLATMGQQGANAIQQQYGRQLGSEQARFGELESQNTAAETRLANAQGQENEKLSQRLKTQEVAPWAKTLMGANQGAMSGAQSQGALG